MAIFSNQVHGHAVPGTEHLTSNIDYFTISTPVDIANNTPLAFSQVSSDASLDETYADALPAGATAASGMGPLDKLIEIIAQRGQPIIMGTPSGSGPYSFRFATEHFGSWAVLSAPPAGASYGAGPQDQTTLATAAASALANAIISAGKDFGFDANTTVTVSNSL